MACTRNVWTGSFLWAGGRIRLQLSMRLRSSAWLTSILARSKHTSRWGPPLLYAHTATGCDCNRGGCRSPFTAVIGKITDDVREMVSTERPQKMRVLEYTRKR